MADPNLQRAQAAALRLVFAPDAESARGVAAAVRTFLAEQGLAERELFSYELCIAEACNNAIEYARGAEREAKPVAEALFTVTQIELRVTDHTAGFVLPDRVRPPSPQSDRGRGLFIIQSVMDEVCYLRSARENTLVMRKKRAAVPVARPPPGAANSIALLEARRELAACQNALKATEGELSFRSETLSAIFRCCVEFGHGSDIEGQGRRLLADLLHLTAADWYVLRLLSADQQSLAVVTTSNPAWKFEPLPLPASGEAPRGIEAAVGGGQAAARFEMLPAGSSPEPLRAVGPEASGFVCPLCLSGKLVGTIAIGRLRKGQPFSKLQEEVVTAFAEFLAIQTINLRERKMEVRNRVVARELKIAQDIQHLLLPRKLPQLAGFGLAGGWHSAREVGGDFYDAIALGGHSLLLMIADVMGKGVPAALFATTMRGALRGLAARSDDPAQLLGGLNRLLYPELSAVSMFITAQVAHVDLRTRLVTAASAGHCPPLFMTTGRRAVAALPTQGVPLGVLPDTEYHNETAVLGKPAMLLLHTDGLTDTRNPTGKMFGQQRLMAWLRVNSLPGRRAPEMRDRLATELNRFRDGATMADDQAFLLLAEDSLVPGRSADAHVRRLRFQPGSFLFSSGA